MSASATTRSCPNVRYPGSFRKICARSEFFAVCGTSPDLAAPLNYVRYRGHSELPFYHVATQPAQIETPALVPSVTHMVSRTHHLAGTPV